jgi:hypothetical protein
MSFIQSKSNFLQYSTATGEVDCAFSSANAAGNTLVAAVMFFNGDNFTQSGTESLVDTNGNTWSRLYAPALWYSFQDMILELWVARNCNAGANTVKYLSNVPGTSIQNTIAVAVAEYSGLGANPVPSTGGENDAEYRGSVPSPYTLTVTDSNGDSITVTVTGQVAGGPGFLVSMAVNLAGGGKNLLLVACGVGNLPSSIAIPSSYGTLTLREVQPSSHNAQGIQLYDSIPLVPTRAQLEQMVLPNA